MKKHRINYYLLLFLAIPLLPIMLLQAYILKRKIPFDEGPDDITGKTAKGENKIKLITIGESTIAGAGINTHKEGFTGSLATELSKKYNATVEWEVVAKSGYSAGKVGENLISNIKSEKADLVVIGLGVNDAFELTPPHKWRKDINRIINKLGKRYPSAQLIFLNMPPVGSFPALPILFRFFCGRLIRILGKELEEAVHHYEKVNYLHEQIVLTEWLKYLEPDAGITDLFSKDGIHPSSVAYKIWAKEASKKIRL